MFHYFHGAGHQGSQGSLSAEMFDDVLAYVERDQALLPAKAWSEKACCGLLREGDVAVSFDDNLRCQWEIALPVLRRRNLTAFWFIPTSVFEGFPERTELYRYFRTHGFPDLQEFYAAFADTVIQTCGHTFLKRGLEDFDASGYFAEYAFYTREDRVFRFLRDVYLGAELYGRVMDLLMAGHAIDERQLVGQLWMDADRLRRLRDQEHVVGMHSHSHPTRIDLLSVDEQRSEYVSNREHLERILGQRPHAMAHPCGVYTEETLRVLRRMGVTLGFRDNMNMSAPSALEYPRRDCADVLNEMVA